MERRVAVEVHLLLAAVRRRLVLILAIIAVGGLSGVTYAQGDEGVYRTSAVLLLDPTAITVPGAQPFTGDPERFVGGQIGVLRSRATAERAAKEIGVSANEIRKTLTVDHVVGSDVVDVVGQAENAALARDVANAVAESYVAQRREQSAAAVQAQLAAVDKQVADVQRQLAGLRTTPSVVDPRQQPLANQYDQLVQRRLSLTAPGAVRDNSAVLDPAQVPRAADRLSPALAGAAGAVVGLLLGTALAVLLEGRRPHVTSRAQAQQVLGRSVRVTFPSGRGRAGSGAVERHSARVLMALVNAHPAPGRRTIAVCATSDTGVLDRLANALVDVEDERGETAEVVRLDADPGRPVEGHRPRLRPARRAHDEGQGELAALLVEPARAPHDGTVLDALDSLPAQVNVAVIVVPEVLDNPHIADVARWATDIVLLVPLGAQPESDLSTAHELLTAGSAKLHPVLVTKRSRPHR
jgi:hypothetical protein